MSVSDIVTYVSATVLVPVVGWATRLEVKQAQLEAKAAADKELFETKLDNQTEILTRIELGMDHRLSRIERALNGYLRRNEDGH